MEKVEVKKVSVKKCPHGVDSFAFCVSQTGKIFMHGGYYIKERTNSTKTFSKLYTYNPKEKRFSIVDKDVPIFRHRFAHTMVSRGKRELVLFGGCHLSDYFNQTVIFNTETLTSQELKFPHPPPKTIFHSALYNSVHDYMLIFGGKVAVDNPRNDREEYKRVSSLYKCDFQKEKWKKILPGSDQKKKKFSRRLSSSSLGESFFKSLTTHEKIDGNIVYSNVATEKKNTSNGRKKLSFGGRKKRSKSVMLGNYIGKSIRKLVHPRKKIESFKEFISPPGRAGHVMFWTNETKGEFYVFGGRLTKHKCSSDMWKFSMIKNTWKQIKYNSDIVPIKRACPAFHLDSKKSNLYIFGGICGNMEEEFYLNDLHVFSLVTHRWKKFSLSGMIPPPLSYTNGSIFVDSGNVKKFFVFGGYQFSLGESVNTCFEFCIGKEAEEESYYDDEDEEKQRFEMVVSGRNKYCVKAKEFESNRKLESLCFMDEIDGEIIDDEKKPVLFNDFTINFANLSVKCPRELLFGISNEFNEYIEVNKSISFDDVEVTRISESEIMSFLYGELSILEICGSLFNYEKMFEMYLICHCLDMRNNTVLILRRIEKIFEIDTLLLLLKKSLRIRASPLYLLRSRGKKNKRDLVKKKRDKTPVMRNSLTLCVFNCLKRLGKKYDVKSLLNDENVIENDELQYIIKEVIKEIDSKGLKKLKGKGKTYYAFWKHDELIGCVYNDKRSILDNFQRRMKELYNSNKLCNMTISVINNYSKDKKKKKVFKVHKSLLVYRSNFLFRLLKFKDLSGELDASTLSKTFCIEVEKMNSSVLDMFLRYMYYGSVVKNGSDKKETFQLLFALLEHSEKYFEESLKKYLTNRIAMKLRKLGRKNLKKCKVLIAKYVQSMPEELQNTLVKKFIEVC